MPISDLISDMTDIMIGLNIVEKKKEAEDFPRTRSILKKSVKYETACNLFF